MENFVYSIQLNDRDWAEFYLASEECNLIQAALATAEEPLPSDLEDGEGEDRWIRGRVDPGLTPNPASCLPRGAPQRRLPAAEVLSGSEDETDLGSVSRFLCDNSRHNTALPQPSVIQRSQSSHVPSDPLGGQQELPGLARECEASSAAGSELSLLEVGVAGFQEHISGPVAIEEPACSVLMDAGASKGIDIQAREHGSGHLGLALRQPTSDIPRIASTDIHFPLPVGNNAVCGQPEPPELKDQNIHPTSGKFEGAEHPELGTKNRQVGLKAGAPSIQDKPSIFQGHSVTPLGTLAPSESHKERVLESRYNEEENAADLKAEGQRDQSEDLVGSVLEEEGQVGREISSASCKANLQKVPEVPEASKGPNPAIVTDSTCSGTFDQHCETAALKTETQKDGPEEVCHHFGPAVPFEGWESPSMAQASQRSNFLEGDFPYGLALEISLEGHSAATTQPQDPDHFICGNTQEQAKKMQAEVAEKRFTSDSGHEDLPEMSGPEMYEYFFADTEGTLAGGGKEKGLKTASISDQLLVPSAGSEDSDSIVAGEATHISVPEVYEHFFNNGAQGRRSWKQLFLTLPASEAKKAARALKSLLSKPARLLRRRPPGPGIPPRGEAQGKLVVFSPRLLEGSQPRPEDLRMAVMSPERPLQLALTHRDMCLGFVAFASWAVRTSNLQAPDAWKIVLLANFGSLSAIRYFRRQIVAGDHGT